MVLFFQCVAEAVVEQGLRGLADLVPGGGPMYDIAGSALKRYRERCQVAQQRAEIQQLAQASFEEARDAAVEAARDAAMQQPEMRPTLELFLTQIPTSIRQSLKRAEDPTGTTVPATFALKGPDDMAKLLPPSLPRFRPGDPLPGRTGWVLERQLGLGGFGEVWLARHPQYVSLVRAVKFCRNLNTRDRDMLHESKVIDQLLKHGRHDHIVQLLDVNLDDQNPWLMYEYVDGGDLTDLIHEWASLPPGERQEKTIAALTELAVTVAHVHRLDPAIVHRDLKPANILRDKSGKLRITDFGISGIAARQLIEDETRGVTTRAGRLQFTQSGSYTPLYASPQQRNGADPDPRDDVHALGVIGYQMMTAQVNQGVGPDFAQDLKEAGADDTLVELLGRSTAAKAERRPKDALEFATKIATLSTKAPIKVEPVPDSMPQRREGTRALASGTGLAILVAALIPSGYLATIMSVLMYDKAWYVNGYREPYRGYAEMWACLAGLFVLSAFISSLICLHRMWRVVARAGEDPTPAAAVGLLLVPFYNLYWMFRAIPGLSAALERELREREPSRGFWTGWRIGLLACILFVIPYLNVISFLLFAVWINMANSATMRLIRLKKQA